MLEITVTINLKSHLSYETGSLGSQGYLMQSIVIIYNETGKKFVTVCCIFICFVLWYKASYIGRRDQSTKSYPVLH